MPPSDMAEVLLQPLVFLLQPPNPAPAGPPAPASRGWLCCRTCLTAPYYSHRWTGPATTAASHRNRTSEPSYSSPRGLPLPRLPRLPVVPFLSLVVVHRHGALGAMWSMWSTTDFHRKSTVHGEVDSWVHGSSNEVPPYYTENNDSSTSQQGPTRRATVFHEKNVSPCLLGPTSYIFARKEVPDSRDPPGRSVRSVVILVTNVYVHTGRSACLQAAAMNRGRVRKGTCCSRGAHVS